MNARVIELSRMMCNDEIKPTEYRSRMIGQLSNMGDAEALELAMCILSRAQEGEGT